MKRRTFYSETYLCLIIASLFTACTGQAKQPVAVAQRDSVYSTSIQPVASGEDFSDSTVKDSAAENAILDAVFDLPEIKQSAKEIEQVTHNKRHLQVWIDDMPHLPDQPFYVVNTGEDNGSNLVTENTFYVYSHPDRILYYDVANDTAISLEDWRQELSK